MYFNFKLFSVIATRACNTIASSNYPFTDVTHTLNEVLSIFEYYFSKYEYTFRQAHPNIRMAQIERIIEAMPCFDRENGFTFDIAPDDYEALINKHFQTQYHNCDYNINHFFNGDIRLLRFYEELY